MSPNHEKREEVIRMFIQENEPCTFGQIKKYISKTKFAFKIKKEENNKPLARELKHLDDIHKIRKIKQKPYPVYVIIQDTMLDTAIMGKLFHEHASRIVTLSHKIDSGYFKDEIITNNNDTFEEKFVKEMIARYGFFLLSTLVKSFDQSVTKKGFDRKIWIDHALDLLEDEEKISEPFLHLLFPKKYTDFTKLKNKPILKKKLDNLKQTMKQIYPKLYGMALQHYENNIEGQTRKIKGLRKYPEIMDNVRL